MRIYTGNDCSVCGGEKMNELTDSSIFVLNDQTLGVIEELGAHMPGGFFI